MNLPSFFIDDSKSDKYEETIDFFLSWTIRCADIKYEESNPILNEYAKSIFAKLIGEANCSKMQFNDVKVWKQSGNVDLWVEFEILPGHTKMALIIENKMYSEIRKGQLEKYREQVEEFYEGQDNRKIKFVLLRPDYEIGNKRPELEQCKKLGYEYLNLEELKDTLGKERTGNDLFDEFWFNWFEQ